MLVSCGARNQTKSRAFSREQTGKRKISKLSEQSLSDATGWEYVAEGGANVIFRHKDSGDSVLRVPKSNQVPFEEGETLEFLKEFLLPVMNNRDPYDCNHGDIYLTGKVNDYYYTKSSSSSIEDMGYRLYGEPVKPTDESFLCDLNEILGLSNRPEHRQKSQLHCRDKSKQMWLLPNVVDFGDLCIELKPKSSLGPLNTTHPQRYDGMAMKQQTCRYCMHQEWKFHTGKIQKQRLENNAYCPMDLFSNDKGRMRRAILALLDDPQNNCKVFQPGGKNITAELVAATNTAHRTLFKNIAGVEYSDLADLIVEGLCESRVLDDLHRAHELDELDIEGIWQLNQLVQSFSSLDIHAKMTEPPVPPAPHDILGHQKQEGIQSKYSQLKQQYEQSRQYLLEPKTCRWLSAIGCTENSHRNFVKKRYKEVLQKFLLATTLKDCSILLSIRNEESLRKKCEDNDKKWSEMEYRIQQNGRTYSILISIIDLDRKAETNIQKYYKLDQDIVHHYSETHGLHKKFCFGSFDNDDTLVQIKGNMMCRLLYPNPVCLLTVYDPLEHTANVMTITWLTAIDNHGTFVCSISKRRYTSELLQVSRSFVLNIPTRDMESVILKIGSSTGREVDKFRELGLRICCPGLFANETSTTQRLNAKDDKLIKHTIALRDCIAHTICIVNEMQDMGQHWLLVCKQQLAWSKKTYFADGKRFIRSSESLPPYLTFLGTKTFGSVV